MKDRVSHLHKSAAEWLKFDNWTPEAGELIIFDPDSQYNYARIKIGDGIHQLKDLKFSIESAVISTLNAHKFEEIIDAGRITEYQ